MTSDHTWTTVLIKASERATQAAKARACARSGLTKAHFTALFHLNQEPGLSSAELARRCFVTPQAMGEVVSRLLASGLVDQQPSPSNRRALSLRLTPAGEQAFAASAQEMDRLDQHLRKALGERASKQLEDLLSRVNRAAQEYFPDEVSG